MPLTLSPPSPPLPERSDELEGRAVSIGPWRLDAVLGRGATSLVYAAHHPGLGVRRALKVQRLPGPLVAERLRREGEVQGRLRHAGLLPVLERFEHEGRVVLVMEQVGARTLEAWVEAHAPVPLAQARALLGEVLDGLDAAHRVGVVHRDLKPANVLVDEEAGRAVLCDFGIARVLGEEADPNQTQLGTPMGTPGFMPPEQWADASSAGVRADVFAAGALVYFTLTGRPPFSGADPTALLRATLEGRTEDLAAARPDCPPALVQAVAACLAPRAEDRPASLGALRRALASDRPAGAGTDTVVPVAGPVAKRILPGWLGASLPGWLGASLGGALIGLGSWALMRAVGFPTAPPAAPSLPVASVEPLPPDEAPTAEPTAEPTVEPTAEVIAPMVPGCVASEGELIGWWWAGTELRRRVWGGVRVERETNVRSSPPDGAGGPPGSVRCVLPADSRVAVRVDPLEIDGQLWVPLYGGDLRSR